AAVLGARRSRNALLLPPGARLGASVPLDPEARGLLFVGSLRYAAHGGDILMQAMARAIESGIDARLVWVAPADEPIPSAHPGWLRVERAAGAQIDRLLPAVRASVTPRRKTPYNDLAVPIKVLEYLGYGRPLLVTDTQETTRIVRDAGAGLIVPDTVDGLLHGITQLMTAESDRLVAWSAAARAAAERNSWRRRAEEIMQLLDLPISAR
ncbi:MAG: glycosyltransferase, partial [Candidatus Limnocylindria bacterium]